MALDFRPGRRCLIVPWAPDRDRGKECVLGYFDGAGWCRHCESGARMWATDWWMVTVEGSFTPDDPSGFIRQAWLIPLPDEDEGWVLFQEKTKPLETVT